MANGNGKTGRVLLASAYVADADRPVYEVGGPSLCRQEFSEDCDVNEIVRRNPNVGMLRPLPGMPPTYYDFTSMPSNLMDSMNMMIEADEAFMKLPAEVRKEFDNDALRFVEFAASPDNLEQMRKWGLAEPEKAPDPPLQVQVVNPASSSSSAPAPTATPSA